MTLKSTLFGLAALLFSSATFAGIVTTSSNVDFLAIDGQKASKTLLKQTKSFNINDTNTHQVVVRVGDLIGGGDKQFLFESSPIVVTFQGTPEDVVISAPVLNNRADVNAFNKQPAILVKTASGKEIPVKQAYLRQEGLLPGANVISDLAEYNASGEIAAVPAFANAAPTPAAAVGSPVATAPASTKTAKGQVTVQGENVAEQMLQYWYQQADKQTQARFIDWVKKQK